MPAAPLALTDAQITAIMGLARPLLPHQRTAFLEMLAARLHGRRELGDGQVHRICAELLREHRLFDPPLESHHGAPKGVSKYRSLIDRGGFEKFPHGGKIRIRPT